MREGFTEAGLLVLYKLASHLPFGFCCANCDGHRVLFSRSYSRVTALSEHIVRE